MILNNWKRNWEYFKANFVIMWKSLIEYKLNFFMAFYEQIFYAGIILILYKIMFDNFADLISWTFLDFILFFLFVDGIRAFCGLFVWKYRTGGLSTCLLNGKFNLYLFKPTNIFTAFYFRDLSTSALFYVLCDFLIILGILIKYYSLFSNLIFGLIILILIILLNFFWKTFILSFAFKYKKMDNLLYGTLDNGINDFFERYPTEFFKLNYSSLYFLILPNFFIGSLLIPLIKGYNVWNIELQLSFLILMLLIFSFGTFLNWHFGLKKYEAFG